MACALRNAVPWRSPPRARPTAPQPLAPASTAPSRRIRAKCQKSSARNASHRCPDRRIFRHRSPGQSSRAPSLHRARPQRCAVARFGCRFPSPSDARSRRPSRPYQSPGRHWGAAAPWSSRRMPPRSTPSRTSQRAPTARSAQTLPRRACPSGIHDDLHFQYVSWGLTLLLDENRRQNRRLSDSILPPFLFVASLEAQRSLRQRRESLNPARVGRLLLLGPGPQAAAQVHQLPQVVGVVIREDQRLTKNRLSIAVRNLREQVGPRIFHQLDHFFQIVLKLMHAVVPRRSIRRHRRLRPVTFGKTGRLMLWIAAELQDVPLRKPGVLQQLPAGMRQAFNECTPFCLGKTINRVHKVHVRAPALQKADKMFAQHPIAVSYSTLPFRGLFCFFLHARFPTFLR